jgi:hypothetical protein
LNSPIPNEKDLADLRVKLTEAGENQSISKQKFQQVRSHNYFKFKNIGGILV